MQSGFHLPGVCRERPDQVDGLVHEGVLDPLGDTPDDWHFAGAALQRARRAVRLMRDLEINPPGVALALELIDEIRRLEAALAAYVEDSSATR